MVSSPRVENFTMSTDDFILEGGSTTVFRVPARFFIDDKDRPITDYIRTDTMPTKVFLKENCSKVRGNKTIIGSANDRVKVHGKHSAFDNFKVAQIYFDRNGYVESLDLHNVIRELSVPVPYCLIAETGRPFQIGDIFETPSEVVINPESRAYDHDESRRESIRTWFQTNGLDPQKQTRFEVEKRVTKDLPIP